MMILSRHTALVGCALGLGLNVSAAAQGVAARLEKDRDAIVERLQGQWVNELQVFFAEEAGLTPEETPVRQDWTFAPAAAGGAALDVSGGGSVFATMSFAVDAEAGVVRSTGSNAPDGCTLAWTRAGDAFDGVAEGPCGDKGVARMLVMPEHMRLERRDGGPAFEMRRARAFTCWVSVLRGVRHGEAGADADSEDWYFQRGVTLHDQGGLATVQTDETPPRLVDLRLRRAEWPYGRNRPSLALYVHQDQDERATSYVWGDYDATRLGINLRWIQASCSAEGE